MAERESLFDALRQEWSTKPTDLGGWANRANQMLALAEKYHAALAAIAGADYRGNRSPESETAWKAIR